MCPPPPLPLTPRRTLALPLSHTNTICPRPGPQWFFPASLWGGKQSGQPGSVGLSLLRSRGTSCSGVAMAQPNICHNRHLGLVAAVGLWMGEGVNRHRRRVEGTQTQQDLSLGRKPPKACVHTRMHTQTHIHGTHTHAYMRLGFLDRQMSHGEEFLIFNFLPGGPGRFHMHSPGRAGPS